MISIKQNSESQPCGPREASAIIFSAVATVMAFIYWLCRAGLRDNSPWIFIHILPLSYFVFLLPSFIKNIRLCLKNKRNDSYFDSHSFLVILSLTLVVVAGLIAPYLPFKIELLFTIAGISLFVWYGIQSLSYLRFWSFLLVMVALLVFSLVLANAAWTGCYENPLFLELLSTGYVQRDTLFHSAVVSMIKTYGIPSTGLNGIPYLPYHFGSHWIFAQISKLTAVNPVQFYQVGYPLIFVPLFFHSLFLFVIDLKESYGEHVERWNLLTNYGFWVVFLVIIIGFIPTSVVEHVHIKNMVTSESYCLSLTLSFLTGAVLLKTADSHLFRSVGSFWIFWVLMTGLVLAITLTKISTGFLFASVLGYLFVRYGLYRSPKCLIGFVLASFVFLAEFVLIVPGPFYWIRGFLPREDPVQQTIVIIAAPLFYNIILSIIYALYRIWEIQTSKACQSINQSRFKYVDLEIIFLLLVASICALMAMHLSNGIHSYFADIQKWFTFILFLSILTRLWNNIKHFRWRFVPTLAVICFSLCVSTIVLKNMYYDARNFFGRLAYYHYRIINGSQGPKVFYRDFEELKEILQTSSLHNKIEWITEKYIYLRNQTQKVVDENERYALLQRLQLVGQMALSEKKGAVLYIPRLLNSYWNMIDCGAIPFVAPALSGLSLIQGLPESKCRQETYGYRTYNQRDFQTLSGVLLPGDIIKSALAKGFQRVLLYKSDGSLEEIQTNAMANQEGVTRENSHHRR